ncbi:MAG: PilN domain-containing protein [Chamaesiphon sp.]
MYSLDINFLKDRPDYQSDVVTTRRSGITAMPVEVMRPLYLGIGVGLLIPLIVGGFWFFLQRQSASLQQQQAALDSELGRLKGLDAQVKQINDEITQVTADTKALASVFNQIKPWSAMLQEIRDRIPAGVQIKTIQSTQVAASAPSPQPTPSPNAKNAAPTAPTNTSPLITHLSISGTANSYNDANNFLLTLQHSPFFNAKETQLLSATLVDNPTPLELSKTQSEPAAEVTLKLPKVVQYQIQTNLNNIPSSELLRDLDRKGAVGLVTRIRTLQEKGVIQP